MVLISAAQATAEHGMRHVTVFNKGQNQAYIKDRAQDGRLS